MRPSLTLNPSLQPDTPVELDIYSHINSTCALGSRMLNGLGGSGDFLRNAKLSIVHAPSARPSKTDPTGISSIVPFASHIDQYVNRACFLPPHWRFD